MHRWWRPAVHRVIGTLRPAAILPAYRLSSSSTALPRDEDAIGAEAATEKIAAATAAAAAVKDAVAEREEPRKEPTLADLDLSIPQVDCRFLADLVRCRRKRKEEYDELRGAALEKVEREMERQGVEPSANAEQQALAALTDEEQELVTHYRPEYNDGIVLIDTRTVPELATWGAVEGSKVVPMHEMWDAFHMTPDQFLHMYGFPKPHPDQTIIFICQFGARSLMAAQILHWIGYPKVMHFRDGFFEWSKQFALLLRKTMTHDHESGNEMRRQATFQAARELQRAVAPEFNALPIQEAAKYIVDNTRSPGMTLVGEGLRDAVFKQIAEQKLLLLGEGPQPPTGSTYMLTEEKGHQTSKMSDFMSKESGVGMPEPEAIMGLSELGSKQPGSFV